MAVAIDGSENVFCIDSKPIKACQNARSRRFVLGCDKIDAVPDWGYCASPRLLYYGYKLRAACGTHGVHSYDMTAASVHDLHYLNNVRWEFHDCMMLGEKGLLSIVIQMDFFEAAGITL